MLSENHSTSLVFIIILMTIILIACIHQVYEKDIYQTIQKTWNQIILCLMFLIFCTIAIRICLFLEQIFHIYSDYNGDVLSVIKATMNFNTVSWTVIAVTLFSNFMLIMNSNFHIIQSLQLYPLSMLLAFSFSLFLLYAINITECRVNTIKSIFSSGGLDPGTSIACSFFYGYLKIVLPASGGKERTGILTGFEKYEANNHVDIPVKKLFILIPSSSYIPSDLREMSNWLEHAKTLDIITLDIAGVKNRTYHNTVYKLRPNGNGKPVFLAVEGATPLKTFLEVQDKSHRYAPLYKEYKKEIIRNFYITLKNLLNDNPDCRDYCELVYYEDDVNNKHVNPALILLERINHYTKQD